MSFDCIGAIIDREIAAHSENGASFVITKDGRTVYDHSAGLADIENGLPFGTDTICRAFSCSKIATSVAAVQLIGRGRLDTAWELSRFYPEFSEPFYIRNGERCPSPPITVRDLLNMTSGIPYPGDSREGGEGMSDLWGRLDQSIRDGRSLTTQEFAQLAGKQPLMFPAGEQWMYGSSADILGAVIEKAADMRLSEYMKINIFDPLGMEDTAFYVPREKRGRLAVLYENAGENPKKSEWVNLAVYDHDSPPAFESGGAGLFSTAADYAKLGAELSAGGKGVISRAAVSFLAENGLDAEQRRTYDWDSVRGHGYGNLVRIMEDRNRSGLMAGKGAFGWDGWTGTYLLCDTNVKMSFTLFVQRCGASTTQLARNAVNAAYFSL
ncbi:MAG: beta-lactamase family protein [Ruminococcus sp.]|nr:beta-lactamase family protein [Ruminococcus sp.]